VKYFVYLIVGFGETDTDFGPQITSIEKFLLKKALYPPSKHSK